MFSITEIELLLSGHSISDANPWGAGNEKVIEDFYRGVVAEVESSTGALSRVEWDHYGSGYASYIDAWFYKVDDSFYPKIHAKYGEHYVGLIVLLSRLSPYFVFMEGEKNWHSHGGSGYLPDYTMVDDLVTPGPKTLAAEVEPILLKNGLVRRRAKDLEAALPQGIHIETNLSDGAYRNFDALYYWYD